MGALATLAKVTALVDVSRPTSRDAKTACHACGAIVGGLPDLFCCPLAVPSKHCLWCGDNLTGTTSFCTPLCSTTYHLDVTSAKRFAPRGAKVDEPEKHECVWCGDDLPKNRTRFCSVVCAYDNRLEERRQATVARKLARGRR